MSAERVMTDFGKTTPEVEGLPAERLAAGPMKIVAGCYQFTIHGAIADQPAGP